MEANILTFIGIQMDRKTRSLNPSERHTCDLVKGSGGQQRRPSLVDRKSRGNICPLKAAFLLRGR